MPSAASSGRLNGLTLNGVLVVLVVQLCFQAAFGYLQVIWFNEVGEKALVHIRRDTYARLVALPMTFFAQRRVGELSSRISADLTQIEDTLTRRDPAISAAGHAPARQSRVHSSSPADGSPS